MTLLSSYIKPLELCRRRSIVASRIVDHRTRVSRFHLTRSLPNRSRERLVHPTDEFAAVAFLETYPLITFSHNISSSRLLLDSGIHYETACNVLTREKWTQNP
jgi:hypothetical protein